MLGGGEVNREPIRVGLEVFATKAALTRRVRTILHGGVVGRTLDDEEHAFMLALLARHPDVEEKIGAGVASFYIGTPLFRVRGFLLRRVDGTQTDFSFLHCITPRTNRADFVAACRRAIADQVVAAREAQFGSDSQLLCPILGIHVTRESSHVDHAPPWTFDVIVDAFVTAEDLDPDRVGVGGFGDGETERVLTDVALLARWCEFHRARATLRVVSKKANLSALRCAR